MSFLFKKKKLLIYMGTHSTGKSFQNDSSYDSEWLYLCFGVRLKSGIFPGVFWNCDAGPLSELFSAWLAGVNSARMIVVVGSRQVGEGQQTEWPCTCLEQGLEVMAAWDSTRKSSCEGPECYKNVSGYRCLNSWSFVQIGLFHRKWNLTLEPNLSL